MTSFRAIPLLALCLISPWAALAQDATAYLKAANQLFAAKDYAKAAQYYQAAGQLDTQSVPAFQGLGTCKYYQGDKQGALAAYEKALAIQPGNTALASFVQNLRAQVGTPAPSLPASHEPSATYSNNASETSKAKSFEVDVMAGVAISTGSGYGFGFGGGAAGRLPMGQGLGLGLALGYYTFGASFPGGSSGLGSLEILGSVKYTMPGGSGFEPYLVGGVGLSMLMSSISYDPPGGSASSSNMNPMAQAGGGVAFQAGKDMKFFGEAKGSIVIGSNGTFTYFPITAGLSFSF